MTLLWNMSLSLVKRASCIYCAMRQSNFVICQMTQLSSVHRNIAITHYQGQEKLYKPGGTLPQKSLHLTVQCTGPNQIRILGTYAVEKSDISVLRRVLSKIGFHGLKEKKKVLQMAGSRLYLCSVELVDVDFFLREFEMEDTLYSWYRVVSLHVWMVMCRLLPEGNEGRYVRNALVKAMWSDIQQRAKRLTGTLSGSTRYSMVELNEQFRSVLLEYDEGLAADDMVLAGALWRTFFLEKCDDPRQIEILLHYIHKQLRHLEFQESELIIRAGLMTFLPLYGDKVNEKRNMPILEEIEKRYPRPRTSFFA